MKIISYHQLTTQEGGLQVQKGMNFGVKGNYSIVLMSTAKNAPYEDEVFDDGVIEYEGHDAPKSTQYDKKLVDQPSHTTTGKLTENGKFLKAVDDYKTYKRSAAKIQVYRNIKPGVWVDMGFYELIDGYQRHNKQGMSLNFCSNQFTITILLLKITLILSTTGKYRVISREKFMNGIMVNARNVVLVKTYTLIT